MPEGMRGSAKQGIRNLLKAAAKNPASAKAMRKAGQKIQSAAELTARELFRASSGTIASEGINQPAPGATGSEVGEIPNTFGSGADDDGMYGASYYGVGRNPSDRENLSGYANYDRKTSNADLQAYITWRFLDAHTSLDVGCALGFCVEAFSELGFGAKGVEYSNWAVENCAPGVKGKIFQGDILKGLPFEDGEFDIVTAFEILEHLPPEEVPSAIRELRRICKGWLFATIPSFGPNKYGPDGWFSGKVRDEVLDKYNALPDYYRGPVPYEDLMLDREGQPIEGHLTIASFDWWESRFEEAGFERNGVIEERMYTEVARFGLTGLWNLYVLSVPGAWKPPASLRSPEEVAEIEKRWGLGERVVSR